MNRNNAHIRPRIAHLINPFLPVTQNWMYNQLVYNDACDHFVLCQTRENTAQFPFDNVYAALGRRSPVHAAFAMLIARARARYSLEPFHSIIKQQRPDLLHGHFAWESWRHFDLVQAAGLPLVTTFYGLDVNKLPRRGAWKKRYPLLFEKGALFMVEGPFMAAELEKLGCPPEKIKVVYLGVDIQRIRQYLDNEKREELNILFVGLGREKKGAVYAAKAFRKASRHHENVRLHVIGDGPYKKEMRNILSGGAASDKAIFHGYVTIDDYLKLLGKTDILLAPSVTAANGDTEGGAPVSVIEAQAAGIAVAGSFHCDIPSIVKHEKTGLLSPERDSGVLAMHLETLITDVSLRKEMGFNGAARAVTNHDIRKQTRKIAAIYRSLL